MKEISLQGNYFAEEFSYVEFNINVCFGRPICAPPDEIEKWFYPEVPKLQVIYTNSVVQYQ